MPINPEIPEIPWSPPEETPLIGVKTTPRFDLEDWHSRHAAYWEHWLAPYVDKPVSALEIGSCEGRSALWLINNVLTHSRSRIHCVDPFSDEGQKGSDIPGEVLNKTYANFCRNVKPYVNPVFKLIHYRTTSFDFLIT